MRSAARFLATLALCCGLSACAGSGNDSGGGGGGGGGGGNTCKKDLPPATISYSQNVQPLFTRSCAVAIACHQGSSAVFGNLSPGASYDSIVNVRSQEQPKLLLVKPGDADTSYLVRKIEGGPDISNALMPLGCPGAPQNGAVCLSNDEIASIRTWVQECAQNN